MGNSDILRQVEMDCMLTSPSILPQDRASREAMNDGSPKQYNSLIE